MKKNAPDIVYEDNLVRLSVGFIRISNYYYFFGSKTIPFSRIERIEELPTHEAMETGVVGPTPGDLALLTRKSVFFMRLRGRQKYIFFTVKDEEAFIEALRSLDIQVTPGHKENYCNLVDHKIGLSAILFLALGVVVAALAIPLIVGMLPPNCCLGIRAEATLANE